MIDHSQVSIDCVTTDLKTVNCAEQHSAQAATLGVSGDETLETGS